MHAHNRAVYAQGLQFDLNHLAFLQLMKEPFEHAALGPAVHAGVDRVPVAETRRQSAPLASMLGDIQNRVDDSEVIDVLTARKTPWFRQIGRDMLALFMG